MKRAGWEHGYSWRRLAAQRPSLTSNQTPVAHSSAPGVEITLRGLSEPGSVGCPRRLKAPYIKHHQQTNDGSGIM